MSRWDLHSATTAEWPEIAALLTASGLPLAGAEDHLADFVVARQDSVFVGCACLERYGRFGLLRSVAVEPGIQASGLGQALVSHVLVQADQDGLDAVALLTTTAASYFPRFGFHVVDRAEIPAQVHVSVEFREACPESAIAMLRVAGSRVDSAISEPAGIAPQMPR